jgi:hypothetical protein
MIGVIRQKKVNADSNCDLNFISKFADENQHQHESIQSKAIFNFKMSLYIDFDLPGFEQMRESCDFLDGMGLGFD